MTSGEIEDAEGMWLLHEQTRCYSDIHIALKENRKHNLQQLLGIAIDQNGLLRCYERMQNCDLSEAAKQTILLPKNSRFTKMLINISTVVVCIDNSLEVINAIKSKRYTVSEINTFEFLTLYTSLPLHLVNIN